MYFDWKGVLLTLRNNRPLVAQLVANILALLVAFGVVQMSTDEMQFNSLEITSAVFVVLNFIALFVGQGLENNQNASNAAKAAERYNGE